MKTLVAWILYVVTPRIYPERWQDRLFEGHVSFKFLWLLPVTIYGANAMHWAINVWFRGAYWCFHPTTSTFSTKGHKWPWYFYISPDATPGMATFGIGGGRQSFGDSPRRVLAALLLFLLLPLSAFAQYAPAGPEAPSVGNALLGFLSPEGVGGLIAMLLTAIGGFQWFSAKRKKLVAMASYYAFHIIEDIGNEIAGEDGFDKTARYLQKVDAYMVAQGYRPLKPGEVEVAKLQASALHGAEVAKAKVVEAAALAQVAAAQLPASPQ